MSGKCSEETMLCTTPNSAGQQTGFGCSYNANCAAGHECKSFVCKPRAAASSASSSRTLGPSQAAQNRFKRHADHDQVARAMAQAFARGRSAAHCPKGFTACASGASSAGLGFEVSRLLGPCVERARDAVRAVHRHCGQPRIVRRVHQRADGQLGEEGDRLYRHPGRQRRLLRGGILQDLWVLFCRTTLGIDPGSDTCQEGWSVNGEGTACV
jgi:hypothetical protein